ncbi:MAG TPA: DUF3108 domain-containing protein [Dongiaceae bacterium]|nr:DUF3108 domain-containing protein [Dongiaceae bacterium]
MTYRIAVRLGRVAPPVLALLAALAAPAAAKPLTLTYLAYLAGFPVLSMTATADLPDGGQQPVGTGPYALNANIVTQGSLASLYPYRMSIAAHGRLDRTGAQPGQFHSEGTIMNRSEAVTLTYHPGGKVDIRAEPLTRQAQEAAAKGTANGTIDPASLVMAVVAAYADKQDCTGTYKLFDGVRRYDLAVQEVGSGNVQFYKQSFYQGPAVECQATPQLIQGFSQMAMQSRLYPQSANIWLANAVQGAPAVPVRIETQNALGKMVFDLVGAQQ